MSSWTAAKKMWCCTCLSSPSPFDGFCFCENLAWCIRVPSAWNPCIRCFHSPHLCATAVWRRCQVHGGGGILKPVALPWGQAHYGVRPGAASGVVQRNSNFSVLLPFACSDPEQADSWLRLVSAPTWPLLRGHVVLGERERPSSETHVGMRPIRDARVRGSSSDDLVSSFVGRGVGTCGVSVNTCRPNSGCSQSMWCNLQWHRSRLRRVDQSFWKAEVSSPSDGPVGMLAPPTGQASGPRTVDREPPGDLQSVRLQEPTATTKNVDGVSDTLLTTRHLPVSYRARLWNCHAHHSLSNMDAVVSKFRCSWLEHAPLLHAGQDWSPWASPSASPQMFLTIVDFGCRTLRVKVCILNSCLPHVRAESRGRVSDCLRPASGISDPESG